MSRRRCSLAGVIVTLLGMPQGLLCSAPETSPPVVEFELDNGMRFLLVDRPGAALTAAVWVVRAGSSDDPKGATGTAHLLEHLYFRGTETIGTRPGALLEERRQMGLEEQLYRRRAASDAESREQFERERRSIARTLRKFEVKGEFARIYTEHGAVGINALTRKDVTTFWLTLPSSKLELWFWMESDRLRNAVLRGFYEEIPVVEQERRQRIDAVPGGPELEQFNERFWSGHPYAWPAIGRAQDLYRLHRSTTESFVRTHYTPDRLTVALVGDLDQEQVRGLAQTYFADLPSRRGLEPAVREVPVLSPSPPVSLDLSCQCRSRVELRFHTLPFDHPDSIALDLLSALLAGRSGRLHRELTLGSDTVFSAVSTHTPLRRAGSFSIEVEGLEGVDPATLEHQTRRLVERLLREGVSDRELERARNQAVTEAARQVKAPLSLALRLAVYDALGDWRRIYELPQRTARIDAAQLSEVARRYLDLDRASVLRLVRAEP